MSRQLKKDRIYLNSIKIQSELSKDVNTKVFSKIISSTGSPVSEGYNGASKNINDSIIPYSRDVIKLSDDLSSDKYPFMIHAELNAILHTRDKSDLIGATLYITHLPCPSCASVISQVGISTVVMPSTGHGCRSVDEQGVKLTNYILNNSNIEVRYVDLEGE